MDKWNVKDKKAQFNIIPSCSDAIHLRIEVLDKAKARLDFVLRK